MPETAPPKPSLGNRILDAVIGLGAMLLLLPAAPILVLIWLLDRLGKSDKTDD